MYGVGLLLGFQLVGELIVWAYPLPISGPICGMAALLAWLCWERRVSDDLGKVTDALLGNMAILFVPVGVGVIVYADLFQSHWLAIVVAVVLGTFVTIAVTAMTARLLTKIGMNLSRIEPAVAGAEARRGPPHGAIRTARSREAHLE